MEDFELLTEDQIEHLFDDENTEEQTSENKEDKKDKDKEEITEVDIDNLFEPESVGNEDKEDKEEREDTTSTKENASPKNFYSSIANALVEDGVTPDLNTSEITDAESFSSAIKKLIENQLDETQKRINDALNNGVEPDEIRFYENTINNLNNIQDAYIEDENNEEFRKKVIFQDLLNRGYSNEDAKEELQEILDNGTDIKKAKRAIVSMKSFYNNKYKEVLNEAKEASIQEEKKEKERIASIKKNMLESDKVFGDVDISKENRQKAFDAITKPVWKDPNTGTYYTAIQKYEKENKEDFISKLGLLYVLTNEFKNIDLLVKNKVTKESKKALKELENTLNNTRRSSDGNLKFTGDLINDSESVFRKYSLDI